jgi:hypothetical protein
MHRSSTVAVLFVLLVSFGCQQKPDVLPYASSPVDAPAGAGGGAGTADAMGGSAGTAGSAGAAGSAGSAGTSAGAGGSGGSGGGDACDEMLVGTLAMFLGVQGDHYRFPIANFQLKRLLDTYIFHQPPPVLTPEELGSDEACNAFRMSDAYEGWRWDPMDLTNLLICPEYQRALDAWLAEHEGLAANCLPDDGS